MNQGKNISSDNKWRNDKLFIHELDTRYKALENGSGKGFTLEQLEQSVTKLRIKKHG